MRRARLFGSAARGELTPGSDIDLPVELLDAVDYTVLLRRGKELEDVTGHRIDLLTSIKPVFRPYIEPDLVEIPRAFPGSSVASRHRREITPAIPASGA